jgi:hypothetical protein
MEVPLHLATAMRIYLKRASATGERIDVKLYSMYDSKRPEQNEEGLILLRAKLLHD